MFCRVDFLRSQDVECQLDLKRAQPEVACCTAVFPICFRVSANSLCLDGCAKASRKSVAVHQIQGRFPNDRFVQALAQQQPLG